MFTAIETAKAAINQAKASPARTSCYRTAVRDSAHPPWAAARAGFSAHAGRRTTTPEDIDMSLPRPAEASSGVDHITEMYGVDLADAYLLPADIGDPALRWHRATAVVAVDIAGLPEGTADVT